MRRSECCMPLRGLRPPGLRRDNRQRPEGYAEPGSPGPDHKTSQSVQDQSRWRWLR